MSSMIIAYLVILILFLCSTRSRTDYSSVNTLGNALFLRTTDDLNAHLSPHIYNVFIAQQYQFAEIKGQGPHTCPSDVCADVPMRVAQVSYPDSDAKWTLCHCVNDPEPWTYLLTHLSRLPLALRVHIHTIMLAPLSHSSLQANLPHGMFTTSPPVITFFGYPAIGTWIHEFAHAVDNNYSNQMFSSSKMWNRALEQDTCVADAYAMTNRQEALAQAAIVKSYLAGRPSDSTVHSSKSIGEPDDLPTVADYDPLLGDYSCMKHQLMALECLDAFYTPQGEGCLQQAAKDMDPHYGTWWELWLVTNLLIVLFMLARS